MAVTDTLQLHLLDRKVTEQSQAINALDTRPGLLLAARRMTLKTPKTLATTSIIMAETAECTTGTAIRTACR